MIPEHMCVFRPNLSKYCYKTWFFYYHIKTHGSTIAQKIFCSDNSRFFPDKLTFVLTGVLAYKMYSPCLQVNPCTAKSFPWYLGLGRKGMG